MTRLLILAAVAVAGMQPAAAEDLEDYKRRVAMELVAREAIATWVPQMYAEATVSDEQVRLEDHDLSASRLSVPLSALASDTQVPDRPQYGRRRQVGFQELTATHFTFLSADDAAMYALFGREQGVLDVRGREVVVVHRPSRALPAERGAIEGRAIQAVWAASSELAGAPSDAVLVKDDYGVAVATAGTTSTLSRILSRLHSEPLKLNRGLQEILDDPEARWAAKDFARAGLNGLPYALTWRTIPDGRYSTKGTHSLLRSRPAPRSVLDEPLGRPYMIETIGHYGLGKTFLVAGVDPNHARGLTVRLKQLREAINVEQMRRPENDPIAQLVGASALLAAPKAEGAPSAEKACHQGALGALKD